MQPLGLPPVGLCFSRQVAALSYWIQATAAAST